MKAPEREGWNQGFKPVLVERCHHSLNHGMNDRPCTCLFGGNDVGVNTCGLSRCLRRCLHECCCARRDSGCVDTHVSVLTECVSVKTDKECAYRELTGAHR